MTARRTAAQVRAEKRQNRRAEQRAQRAHWAAREDERVIEAHSFPEVGLVVRRLKSAFQVRWTVPAEPQERLLAIGRLRQTLARIELVAVADAREDGLSWDDIGWALEVSGEAVRKRLAAQVDALMSEPR